MSQPGPTELRVPYGGSKKLNRAFGVILVYLYRDHKGILVVVTPTRIVPYGGIPGVFWVLVGSCTLGGGGGVKRLSSRLQGELLNISTVILRGTKKGGLKKGLLILFPYIPPLYIYIYIHIYVYVYIYIYIPKP